MIFDGDVHRLGGYLRTLADRMGLQDWRLGIGDSPPDDESNSATVEVVYGRRVAVISFHKDWATQGPQELRQTCVHELLHCHFDAVMWPINGVANLLGEMIYKPLCDSVRDRIESGIDAVAEEWAESLPLPDSAQNEEAKAA